MNTSKSIGARQGQPQALYSQPSFTGAAQITYLCDAGCRPNPGTHLPIIWDGHSQVLAQLQVGTNHRAAYQAVHQAFADANHRKFTHVEIELTSSLIFRQLTTGGFCRNNGLQQLRAAVYGLAALVAPVRLVLVTEPFLLGSKTFPTRHKLRDRALTGRLP